MANFGSNFQCYVFVLLLEVWQAPLMPFSFHFPSKTTSWGRCGRTTQMVAETLNRGGGPGYEDQKKRSKNRPPLEASLEQLSAPLSAPLGGHSYPTRLPNGSRKSVSNVLGYACYLLCTSHVKHSEKENLFVTLGYPI